MKSKKELKCLDKAKLEREIRVNDLSGKEKKIYVYPIRTDTIYILLKPTKKSPQKIDHAIDKIGEYLSSIGFKRKSGRDCIRFINEYGLTIFYGKVNQYHKERALKFQGTGQFLIYAQAEMILRRLVHKVNSILIKEKVLCDKKITRIDPSVLILAQNIDQIICDFPLGNNMKQASYFYEGTSEVSGVSFKNSKIQLKCYDKQYDIQSSDDYSADYLEYYYSYIQEAKEKGLKIFRLELKISNRAIIFENYETKYFSKNWNNKRNEECLLDLFSRFYKTHKFKKPKDNQKSVTDRRNIARWDIDPMTKEIFTGLKVILRNNKRKKKFSHGLNAPRNIRGLQDCIKMFTKELARINPHFLSEDLDLIQKDILVQYGIEKYNVKISVMDRIDRQAAFRLSIARGKEEKKLINDERDKLVKDLSIRKSHGRGLSGDTESKAREALLKKYLKENGTS